MAARLPPPRPAYRSERLAEATGQRLDRLEHSLSASSRTYRAHYLKVLHEQTVHEFINSPGFGVARMYRPYAGNLTAGLRSETVVPQPQARGASAWSSEEPPWKPLPL